MCSRLSVCPTQNGEELNRLSNAEKIILFSHYPHSCSTSGSSFATRTVALNKHPELKEKISVIDRGGTGRLHIIVGETYRVQIEDFQGIP